MKKRLSSLIAGFLIASQLFLSCAGMASVKAETLPGSGTVSAGDYLQGGYIKRVSVDSNGVGGNDYSLVSSISADGRFVAFVSNSSNLVPGDTNGAQDIFVCDNQSGQTERVSVSSTGVENPNGAGSEVKISPNGRYVAFIAHSTTLVPKEQASTDVYLRDRWENTTILANTSSAGVMGNGVSFYASFGSSENFVSFTSYANNLVPEDHNNRNDIFIRNLQSGDVERVSVASDGTEGDGDSYGTSWVGSSVSSDGNFVIFRSSSTNLISGETNNIPGIYIRDRLNKTTKKVLSAIDSNQGFGVESLSIGADGNSVIFSSITKNLVPGDNDDFVDIFVYDIPTGTIKSLSDSINETGSGHWHAMGPSVSADGRYVVFSSDASDLVPEDSGAKFDIFVYDLTTDRIVRASVTEDGNSFSGDSNSPSISNDGRYISFVSYASDLVSNDSNNNADIFLMKNPLYPVEAVSDTPDLSSLPVLPYDYRGYNWQTVYLKDRVVFKNVLGEYVAFDFEEGYKIGISPVYQYSGGQEALPDNTLVYARFSVDNPESVYKYVDGKWESHSYDRNSWYYSPVNQVMAPGDSLIFSSVDLKNTIGNMYSGKIETYIPDASFTDFLEHVNSHGATYKFALPTGASTLARYGEVVLGKNASTPRYICADGIDNDGDGATDAEDISCHTDWNAGNMASYNPKTRSEAEDNIKRVPVQDDGTELNIGAASYSISADGKLIAYSTLDVLGGWTGEGRRTNVFVYDTTIGKSERISNAQDGSDSNGSSDYPVISSDGKYVAFSSGATNLVSNDTDSSSDIFVRDLENDMTILVSKGMDGKAAGHSTNPSIGGRDGRYISFESEAGNLVPNETIGQSKTFVYDIETGIISCVSLTMDGIPTEGYGSYISSASNYVAFVSRSSLLVPDDNNGVEGSSDIFVRNLDTGETERASLSFEGKEVYAGSAHSPYISPDGNLVTFIGGYRFVADDISGLSGDTYIHDRSKNTTERLSVFINGTAGKYVPYQPKMSVDNQFVVFSSVDANVVAGDTNGFSDVFIGNLSTHEIKRLNISPDGMESNNSSYLAGIAPDGKYILISSGASNLVKGDVNGLGDTFIVKNPFIDFSVPALTQCADGIDNDGDGLIDVADGACHTDGDVGNLNSFDATLDDESKVGAVLLPPTELKQRNESDGAEVGVGKIINEGAADSADSVFLSAKVEAENGGNVFLEVEAEKIYETEDTFSIVKLKSTQVASGEVAMIDFAPEGGLYKWKARTVDENGGASEWVEFGNNDATEADFISSSFSFIYLTDVHLGSNTAFLATLDALKDKNTPWYESLSYPRFTDVLYDIEKLNPKPDFILIGGDSVEYNDERWLRDFKSITEDFSNRTGIEIYFVPGNHERYDSASSAFSWEDWNFSGGNDYLNHFLTVMGDPKGAKSFFADTGIMNLTTSGPQGLNKYNYYFYHDGFQFIGLDSGEDAGEADFDPEGSGLNENVVHKLNDLMKFGPDVPRIIFMHHPIYNGEVDTDYYEKWGVSLPDWPIGKEQTKTDEGTLAQNAAITNHWGDFEYDCYHHNVQLVLSGHEHNSSIYNQAGDLIYLSGWPGLDVKEYPLYVQTQSAGKNDNHGYRVVDVENGRAIPRESETNIPKYEKIYSDLDPKNELEFRAYDSSGKEITMKDNGGSEIIIGDKDIYTLFLAGESDRKIVYEDTENSQFEIKNNNSFESGYNFMTQKREEGTEPNSVLKSKNVWGYGINNPEMCNAFGFSCSNGFLVEIEDGGYKALYFKDIKLKSGFSDKVSVDWSEVGINDTWSTTDVKGVDFVIDGNSKTSYDNMGTFMTVDLNSPGELRVFKDGAVTGVVDGEIKEDIPYSMYVPETETVYIFGDTREEVARDVTTQVVGSYEATYDLSISLSENKEEKVKFMAYDVLTNNQTTHQFSADWDTLEQGGNGVKMETDENKDGVFNTPVFLDETLSFPKANIGAGVENYSVSSVEGTKITFDGSGSSDADGSIALYEWDFNGDGTYDASSAEKTIDYTYGDDFAGKVFLKVTDDEGLTNVISADVKISNVTPVINSTEDKNIEILDSINLETSFTDAGTLDTHTASIDWGDGTKTDITPTGENLRSISASHNYGAAGNYAATLSVKEDDGATATETFVVTVTKRTTTLAYDGETAGRYGDTVKLSATLADKLGALADKNVTFQIGAQAVSAITDSNGKATAEIAINWIADNYPVKAAFREEGLYLASEKQSEISVKSIKQIKQDALTKLKTLAGLLRQKDLEKAASDMEDVLASKLWADDYHLDAKYGNKVFDNEKQVIKDILKLTEKEKLPMSSEIRASLQLVIDDILFSDEVLVDTVLAQAKSLTARTPKFSEEQEKEIEKAEAASSDALREVGKGNVDKAVDDFKKAWNSIQAAIEFALK